MNSQFISSLKNEFSGYNWGKLSQDIMAGITVAAVALPLALAFGVSSGADAAAGLITAILAGLIIGALSGASYQISGPTGAMAAILMGLSVKYGVEGVFTAGLISGIILLICAVLKLGRLISFIPSSVITGFTSGIAIVIALGQIDNFFGTVSSGENAIEKLLSYFKHGFSPNPYSVMFGSLVILLMIIWPKRWNSRVPASLIGIITALILNLIFKFDVSVVGEIPKTLLLDNRLMISKIPFDKIAEFIMPAISIASLGMIESLLCGASAGKIKGEKLNADQELMAQGIGNIIIPFFGGVPATAAIARTSVAIKSGGNTRLVSVFHALVMLSTLLLGPLMSQIPLSALAGVLIVTAWRMNEWKSIKNIFNKRFKTAITQFLVTMAATVWFDLTLAIVLGVVVSIFFFVAKSCDLNVEVGDVDADRLVGHNINADHRGTKIIYITGPLFFGTQDKLNRALEKLDDQLTLIFSMRGVPSIDESVATHFNVLVGEYKSKGIKTKFCGVQSNVKSMFDRCGLTENLGKENFYWDAVSAITSVEG